MQRALRGFTLLIPLILLGGGCASLKSYDSDRLASSDKLPVDVSKFKHQWACQPESTDTSPIAVSGYILTTEESALSNEIIWIIDIKGTQKRFLTQARISGPEVSGPPEKEIISRGFWLRHHAKTNGNWKMVTSIKAGMTIAEAEAENDKMIALFRSHLPQEYRTSGFKEIWEGAGCTTHGPVPFA